MRRSSALIASLAVLALSLAPSVADARLGGGGSFGSRGGRTYSAPPPTSTAPSYSAPFERSMTPNAPSYGAPSPSYGGQGYGARPGMFGGGFGSGLLGGLIGAGIGGMLFRHGMFGGIGGFGSIIGLMIQLALIYFAVWFVWRLVSGGQRPSFAGPAGGFGSMFSGAGGNAGPRPVPVGGGGARPSGPPLAITPADYQAFERVLQTAQAAWTAGDLASLQRIATPEMVGYFGEQLAEQASRGVRNSVTDVRLVKGDLAEAWREGAREYATVAMRFSMIDVTRDATGRIVDGSPTEHVTATETWTFLRAGGGQWILSAIQQAG